MFDKVRVFEVGKSVRRLPSYVTVCLHDPVLSALFKLRYLYETWAVGSVREVSQEAAGQWLHRYCGRDIG
jgi:hypothetical protein